VNNPKTTIAGYVGLLGTVLTAVGALFPTTTWGQTLLGLGVVLKGADSVGNLASRDGGH
jgi:hypothetical protein